MLFRSSSLKKKEYEDVKNTENINNEREDNSKLQNKINELEERLSFIEEYINRRSRGNFNRYKNSK